MHSTRWFVFKTVLENYISFKKAFREQFLFAKCFPVVCLFFPVILNNNHVKWVRVFIPYVSSFLFFFFFKLSSMPKAGLNLLTLRSRVTCFADGAPNAPSSKRLSQGRYKKVKCFTGGCTQNSEQNLKSYYSCCTSRGDSILADLIPLSAPFQSFLGTLSKSLDIHTDTYIQIPAPSSKATDSETTKQVLIIYSWNSAPQISLQGHPVWDLPLVGLLEACPVPRAPRR